jgi:hypothetical protein
VLKAFAARVARMIREAPPFEADWPIVQAPGLASAKIGLARL